MHNVVEFKDSGYSGLRRKRAARSRARAHLTCDSYVLMPPVRSVPQTRRPRAPGNVSGAHAFLFASPMSVPIPPHFVLRRTRSYLVVIYSVFTGGTGTLILLVHSVRCARE